MSDSNGPDSNLRIKENHRGETTKNGRNSNMSPLMADNKNEPLDGGHSVQFLPGTGENSDLVGQGLLQKDRSDNQVGSLGKHTGSNNDIISIKKEKVRRSEQHRVMPGDEVMIYVDPITNKRMKKVKRIKVEKVTLTQE